ncbi:MAG: hypothetical protein ACOY3I_03845 [Verrucomicrobiota bacterium]
MEQSGNTDANSHARVVFKKSWSRAIDVRLSNGFERIRQEKYTAPISSLVGFAGHAALMWSATDSEASSLFRGLGAGLYIGSQALNLGHPIVSKLHASFATNNSSAIQRDSSYPRRYLRETFYDYLNYPFKYFAKLGIGGSTSMLMDGLIKSNEGVITMSLAGLVGNKVLNMKQSPVQETAHSFKKYYRRGRNFIAKHQFKITCGMFQIGAISGAIKGYLSGDAGLFTACACYAVSNTMIGITQRKTIPSMDAYSASATTVHRKNEKEVRTC